MWNDDTRTLYYQVGIGEGNGQKPPATTTSGGFPRPTTPTAAEPAVYRYIREPPGLPRRRARRTGQPEPRRPRRGRVRALLPGVRGHRPELASRCLQAGEHIFDLADTDPQGNLLTAFPYGFYPERNGATTSSWARPSCRSRCRRADGLPAGLPHTEAGFYLATRRRTGPAPTSRNPARKSEALNLYDVSRPGRLRARACAPRSRATPAGWRSAKRRCSETSRGKLERRRGAGRQATRSASASRGPNRTPPPTATGPVGDGLRVRRADRRTDLRGRSPQRWLANVLGANAWGVSFIIGDGTVFTALSPAPGRQPRRLARRLAAGPRRRRGRGPERRKELRQASKACASARRAEATPSPASTAAAPCYRDNVAVVHEHRAGDRPDRALDARVRLADRRTGRTGARPVSGLAAEEPGESVRAPVMRT